MKRSAGITVVAILSLLGSLLTLALGLVMLAVMVFVPAHPSSQFPGSPAIYRVLFFAVSLIYLLPAAWGITTSIGLWRLKNWARISIIVFAVILILMGGFTGLFTLVMPFPSVPNAGPDPSLMSTIRLAMGGFWLTLLGIGIWWLVFFTRASVKAQFGQSAPAFNVGSSLETTQSEPGFALKQARKRPLSITIIAWLLLAGSMFMPLAFLFRAPAVLFTSLVTGWAGAILYLSFFVAQLGIGIGLLRLKPAARSGAIAYFVFVFVNTAVFYFAPGGHARLLALMESEQLMFPWMRIIQNQPQYQLDFTPSLMLGSVIGLVLIVVQLYFLVTSKLAFRIATHDPQSPSSSS